MIIFVNYSEISFSVANGSDRPSSVCSHMTLVLYFRGLIYVSQIMNIVDLPSFISCPTHAFLM